MNIEPVFQSSESDCGVACVQMVCNHMLLKNRGISGLSSSIDGLQIRTIESFFREKGCCVVSGNMDIKLLKHYIKSNIPVIVLTFDHYVLVTGFEGRRIIYNCPMEGRVSKSVINFKKQWMRVWDDTVLFNWGIAAYV